MLAECDSREPLNWKEIKENGDMNRGNNKKGKFLA